MKVARGIVMVFGVAGLGASAGCGQDNPGCCDEPPGTTSGAGGSGTGAGSSESSGANSTSTGSDVDTGTSTQSSTSMGTGPGDSTSGSTGENTTGEDPMLPADILDLTDWKLTLPIGSVDDPDAPLEILQPELATYEHELHFFVDPREQAVVFMAHAGGVTTSGSGYPRSELREMQDGGARLASWSTSEGVHTMTITQAITAVPPAKPHVVAGQIHDADDDLIMIRLEDDRLFVEGGGDELGDLDPEYALGEVFTVRIEASGGTIDIYHDDLQTPAVSVDRDVGGCYFKAGAYTQSNLETGDDADAQGEVVIHDLQVVHQP